MSEEFKAEKLKGVGTLAVLTTPRSRGPLGFHVVHGAFPSLSRVYIDIPAVLFLGSGPVRNGETLEESAWVSVESHITDTFKQSLGVEVLGVDMVHDVGLLVELVAVDILNAEAYIIIN